MAKTLQFKRYSTTNLANTTGAIGELIVDSTKNAITVHDASTPGGWPMALESSVNAVNNAQNISIQLALNTANLALAQANTDLNYLAANVITLLGIDASINASIQSAWNTGNTAASNTIYIQSGLNTANANISVLFGINTTQNTNITTANNAAQAAYNSGNTNATNIASVNNYSNSAYAQANITAGGLITANANIALLQGSMTTANANIAMLIGIQTTQNTNITTANNAAWAGYAQANVTIGGLNSANANIALLQGSMTTANANIVMLIGIQTTQNTNINAAAQTIPQNAQSTNYTLQLTDAGKHIYYTQASNTILYIPTTSNVAFSNGSTIMIVSRTSSSANVTVSPNTGVSMYLAGNTTSASRNVTTYGIASLIQVAANTWFINGTGVS
jgi:hypothetical protein